jgi:hypothetical protein
LTTGEVIPIGGVSSLRSVGSTVVVTTVDGIRHVDGGYNSADAATNALADFVDTLKAFNSGPASVSSISIIDQGDYVTVRTLTVVNGVVTVV